MITARLTFRARYGQGDELVALFKDWFKRMARPSSMSGARIYTDATGPMFTVVTESDFADMNAYAAFWDQDSAMYVDQDFQAWSAKMQAVTEAGERQLFNMESLA